MVSKLMDPKTARYDDNVPRVNQLDAIQLDSEIAKIIKEQLTKAFLNTSIISNFQPELDLMLRALLWYFSVAKKGATYGQQLLFISFDKSSLNKTRLILHFMLDVVLKYIIVLIKFRLTRNVGAQKIVNCGEILTQILSVFNFFRFVRSGRYSSLVNFVLGLKCVSAHETRRREIGYGHMTRELLWSGFLEFFATAFELIDIHSIKGKVARFLTNRKIPIGETNNSSPVLTLHSKCPVCLRRPTMPYHMGCSHIFCYYCLKGNHMADPGYQCPKCHQNGPVKEYRVNAAKR